MYFFKLHQFYANAINYLSFTLMHALNINSSIFSKSSLKMR